MERDSSSVLGAGGQQGSEPDWPVLDRYLAGEATVAEKQSVEKWSDANTSNHVELEALKRGFSADYSHVDIDDLGVRTKRIFEDSPNRITSATNGYRYPSAEPKFWSRWSTIGGVVAVLLVGISVPRV